MPNPQCFCSLSLVPVLSKGEPYLLQETNPRSSATPCLLQWSKLGYWGTDLQSFVIFSIETHWKHPFLHFSKSSWRLSTRPYLQLQLFAGHGPNWRSLLPELSPWVAQKRLHQINRTVLNEASGYLDRLWSFSNFPDVCNWGLSVSCWQSRGWPKPWKSPLDPLGGFWTN